MTYKILTLTSKKRNLILELDKYKPIVDKFTYSFKKLDMILNSQWAVFNRADLGYNPNDKQKCVNNFFVKSIEVRTSIYHCCGKTGHKSYECNFRKHHKVSSLTSKTSLDS